MKGRSPRRRVSRAPLTRERVVRAASELADERGLEAVTMRALGKRLGVEGASLYNHVTGRADLLDGMTELVAEEIELPSLHDWREVMRRRARSAREVFSRHPWASVLLDSRAHRGPAQLAYADRLLGTLLAAGFSPRAAANALFVLDSYVYGFHRQEANLALPEGVEASDVAKALLKTLPPDTYPALHRVAEDFMVSPHDAVAVFDLGLDLILEGLQRTLEAG